MPCPYIPSPKAVSELGLQSNVLGYPKNVVPRRGTLDATVTFTLPTPD